METHKKILLTEETIQNNVTTISTPTNYTYKSIDKLGKGAFGMVFKSKCEETGEIVAIKNVLQDSRYKNRELQIMKQLDHPNIIKLKNYFYTPSNSKDVNLNVVMECIPETLSNLLRDSYKTKTDISMLTVKLYSYQMLKSINYIHSLGICHRDIKPQNILIDPQMKILKLCDFGSAKKLIRTESNVSYICSRYYRAPELIFSSINYTFAVDTWSVGCVIAELILAKPVFMGENSIDQLVEIIKVLGTPTRKQIESMNPDYKFYKFPIVRCFTWKEVFKNCQEVPEDFIDLLKKILVYDPEKRFKPLDALAHSFFDELRDERIVDNIDKSLLDILFHFSREEKQLDHYNAMEKKLIPSWYKNKEN